MLQGFGKPCPRASVVKGSFASLMLPWKPPFVCVGVLCQFIFALDRTVI